MKIKAMLKYTKEPITIIHISTTATIYVTYITEEGLIKETPAISVVVTDLDYIPEGMDS